MKTRDIITAALLALCLAACFDDDTTLGTGAISEISIEEGSISALYDIDKNETLTIHPVVHQTMPQKALTYTWEIEQAVYSTEAQFEYTGNRLGSFNCRLIVANEDGKAFFPFTLNVNSPYEEGITLLSHNDEGESMLSFMLKQRTQRVEDHFAPGDCFALNNPDEAFAANAVDMVQCDGSLIIACKGGGPGNDAGTLYYLNEKTFVVENMLRSEYADFRPTHLGIPANGAIGVAYPILSEDGKAYEFSTTEGVLSQAATFSSQYDPRSCIVYSGGTGSNFYIHLWDTAIGDVCMLYRGYGPYYCSTEYLCEPGECVGDLNYFNGHQFVTMFSPRNPQEKASEEPPLVVVTQNGGLYTKHIFSTAAFWLRNETTQKNDLVVQKAICGFGASSLTADSPLAASGKYLAMFYGDGNRVLRWNYTTGQRLDALTTQTEVGSAEAVVTCLELSPDQEELYVAFCEPQEQGLNGHVWIYATDSGELLRQYDNVAYRPTRIIYKKK